MDDSIVRIQELAAQDRSVTAQAGAWTGQLKKVREAVRALCESENMEGAAADRVREYFAAVYGIVQDSLDLVLATLSGGWCTYFSDYRQLDGSTSYVIPAASVEAVNRAQQSRRRGGGMDKERIGEAVQQAAHAVSDLADIAFKGIDPVYREHDSLAGMLDGLVLAIHRTEEEHLSDFTGIDAVLANLHSLLAEMSARDASFRLNFDSRAFKNSETCRKLEESCSALAEAYERRAAGYRQAEEIRKGFYDQLRKEEEEQKEHRGQ